MRSPKNQILLGVAVAGLTLAGGRFFYEHTIRPLRQQEKVAAQDVADLRRRVEGARETIRETREQERAAERARDEVARLQGDVPDGSAMTWLPELVKSHFARSGIAVKVVRLNAVMEEPNLPAFSRGFWSVALAVEEDPGKVAELLLAVAEIEPRNSFVRVLDFAIRPNPEDPGGRIAVMNVAALVAE